MLACSTSALSLLSSLLFLPLFSFSLRLLSLTLLLNLSRSLPLLPSPLPLVSPLPSLSATLSQGILRAAGSKRVCFQLLDQSFQHILPGDNGEAAALAMKLNLRVSEVKPGSLFMDRCLWIVVFGFLFISHHDINPSLAYLFIKNSISVYVPITPL